MFQLKKTLAGLAVLVALTGGVEAATCTGIGRTFTVMTTPDAACRMVAAPGADNISGNAANDPIMIASPGINFLSKFTAADSSTNGILNLTMDAKKLAGTFSINLANLIAPVGYEYFGFVVAFKSGGNALNSAVWAAFDLPTGVTSGDWAISGKNALSHANLYAYTRVKQTPPPTVPVPASAALLLAGIAAMAGLRRRKV